MADKASATGGASVAMANLRADLQRYRQDSWIKGSLWWITERTVWAVVAYRLSQRVLEIRQPWLRNKLAFLAAVLGTVVECLTTIKIAPTTEIGPGMRIYHGVGLAVNAGAVIGERVVLRHGVTIGALEVGGQDFPIIGDDVDFGAYAQVFGKVTVGDRAKIGTMTVVLKDVPADATVFGVPGRVVTAPKSQPSAAAE